MRAKLYEIFRLNRKLGTATALVLLLLCVSCKNEPRPSGKDVKESRQKQTADLIEFNKALLENQLLLLQNFADSSSLIFNKDSLGFFISINGQGANTQVNNGDWLRVSYTVKELNGVVIDSFKTVLQLGKTQGIPTGIHLGLQKMALGDESVLLLPFTLAYGVKGLQGKVLPYTPVLVELTIVGPENR